METDNIIGPDDPVLVTGSTGFIGPYIVESLLRHGFRNIRAFARPSSDTTALDEVVNNHVEYARVEVIRGNLLSRQDCAAATRDVKVIIHLARGSGKSFPDGFMNAVVTTRNLLDSTLLDKTLRRFVNVSSFAVYTNSQKRALDESAPIEEHPERSGDAYVFAKVRQEEMVKDYAAKFGLPYVIVRPGYVYGPGKGAITSRVGIDSFGVFLHTGGSNSIPFTYVENCADAIVLSAVRAGADAEVFNIVDDNLPSSRQFLRLYKRNVKPITSIYIPRTVSYGMCWFWEKYSSWSAGQLPPAFSRRRWRAEWKKTSYSNQKVKASLGWTQRVATNDGLMRYFEGCKEKHA